MYKTFFYNDFEVYLLKQKKGPGHFQKAKREYWKDYCGKLNRLVDISSVWKRIKGMKEGSKSQIPNLIMDNGKTIAKSAKEKQPFFFNVSIL